jgi:methyltransferase-like protein 23
MHRDPMVPLVPARDPGAEPADEPRELRTDTGVFPLHEFRMHLAGRQWSVLHTGAVVTHADEADYFHEVVDRLPYGVALWPSAIALAHELAARADAFRGTDVLELGAGTGLPGMVAAALGARVVQTDRPGAVLDLCRRNGQRNGARGIEYRGVEWDAWDLDQRFTWILGADILYAESGHPHLRHIFASNLAAGGRLLLADPYRAATFQVLGELEGDGWQVTTSTWKLGEGAAARSIGIFEAAPP